MWLDNLRAMKDHSELTTKEIAYLSKIPEPTLEKIFAGATKDPKLETIRQLVHFFGYTLDDLEDNENEKSPSFEMKNGLSAEKQMLIDKIMELDGRGIAIVDAAVDAILAQRSE